MRVLFLLALALACGVAGAATSEPALVILQPAKSSFWCTATNSTVGLKIDYPFRATRANLTIVADAFALEVPNITADDYTVTFPEPTTPEREDVYQLTLTFDTGDVRQATLAVIQGSGVSEPVTTTVRFPQTTAWRKTPTQAVLPIPESATALGIDGASEALPGAQGWRAWRSIAAGDHTLYLANESTRVDVALYSSTGVQLFVY